MKGQRLDLPGRAPVILRRVSLPVGPMSLRRLPPATVRPSTPPLPATVRSSVEGRLRPVPIGYDLPTEETVGKSRQGPAYLRETWWVRAAEASVVAGSQISIAVPINADAPVEVLAWAGPNVKSEHTAAGDPNVIAQRQFDVRIFDASSEGSLFSDFIDLHAICGTGPRPFRLCYPHLVPPGGGLTVRAVSTASATRDFEMSFRVARLLPQEPTIRSTIPTVQGLIDPNLIVRAANGLVYFRQFYVYNLRIQGTEFTSNGTAVDRTLTIHDDADFEWRATTSPNVRLNHGAAVNPDAAPFFDVQIFDGSSGQFVVRDAMDINGLAGVGRFPHVLTAPRVFRANSRVRFIATRRSSAATDFEINLIGARLLPFDPKTGEAKA